MKCRDCEYCIQHGYYFCDVDDQYAEVTQMANVEKDKEALQEWMERNRVDPDEDRECADFFEYEPIEDNTPRKIRKE